MSPLFGLGARWETEMGKIQLALAKYLPYLITKTFKRYLLLSKINAKPIKLKALCAKHKQTFQYKRKCSKP
jgi:hypothetical protein